MTIFDTGVIPDLATKKPGFKTQYATVAGLIPPFQRECRFRPAPHAVLLSICFHLGNSEGRQDGPQPGSNRPPINLARHELAAFQSKLLFLKGFRE